MSQAWNGTKKESPERRTYTVEDIAHILGIGRTSAYLLVKEGHFKIVRIGNAIRISKRSFDEWLESLEIGNAIRISKRSFDEWLESLDL